MAKAKQTRRMMAMALAASMVTSMAPVQVFADEGESNPSTVEDSSTTSTTTTSSGEGTLSIPKVTVTVSETKNADGDVTSTTTETKTEVNDTTDNVTTESTEVKTETVTPDENTNRVTTETKTDFDQTVTDTNGTETTDDDQTVVKSVDSESTVVTTGSGKVKSDTGWEEGTETTTTTNTDSSEISVPIFVPEQNADDSDDNITTETTTDPETGVTTTTTTVSTPDEVVIEGDTDKSDGEWDYTETTTSGRDVSVNIEKIEIFNGDGTIVDQDGKVIEIGKGDNNGDGVVDKNDGFLSPIEQVWQGNENGLWNKYTAPDAAGIDADRYVNVKDLNGDYKISEKPEGGDVAFTGYGEEAYDSANNTYAPYYISYKGYNYVQDTNEDGSLKVDENGNPVYKLEEAYSGTSYAINFILSDVITEQTTDEYGNVITEQKMTGPIHTGYCVDLSTGANPGEWYEINNLENSGYYDAEYADNIRAIVNNGYWGTLKAGDFEGDSTKYETGSLTDVITKLQNAYKEAVDNKEEFVLTKEEVDDIVKNLNEGEAITATQMAIWNFGNGWDVVELEVNTGYDSDARINALAKYLTSLSESAKEDTVIKADQFIESMDFIVGDKVDSYIVTDENGNEVDVNADADDTNDAYNVSLKFALVVQPDEKDNLVVKVVDANNKVVASARIAGANAEGEDYDTLTPDNDGNYTLTGLKLVENEDIEFSLKLEGAQYLESGVYIYTSVDSYSSSQTFVGLGEGYQTVDVGMAIDMTFNVEEGKITKKHSWKKTWDYEDEGSGGGHHGDDDDDDDDGRTYGDDDDDDGLVAGDEEENAADDDDGLVAGEEDEIIAATSDSNHTVGAAGGMFAALAGMFMLRKKKEKNL